LRKRRRLGRAGSGLADDVMINDDEYMEKLPLVADRHFAPADCHTYYLSITCNLRLSCMTYEIASSTRVVHKWECVKVSACSVYTMFPFVQQ